MGLPVVKATKDAVTQVQAFYGVNKGLHISESEFEDMQNMTNDYFPVLSNRKKRAVISKLVNPMGVMGGRYIAYVDDNDLYYNQAYIASLEKNNVERQLVMMGAYLCVFPDGIIYNTYTKEEPTKIAHAYTSANKVEMRMCKYDGTDIEKDKTYIGKDEPSHDEYDYWLDTSQKEAVLKMYSNSYSMWTSVATTYIKISVENEQIGKGFKEYDSVKITGIEVKGYNDYDFNWTEENKQHQIIYKCSDDYIMIAGLIDNIYEQTAPITVERTLPEMDFVCELDNRIWGCSSKNHEIYACKQGDPTNWNAYAGLSTDSYAATVGTQDDFTGMASYAGYMFFFKEEGFHRLYGTQPSNYELVFKPCRGVQKGCSKSIAIVNEVLMYKARDAVVAYDGSINTVSENLGIEPYYEASAVAYRNKYYVSMRDADYKFRFYVYDITKNTWVIEDDIRVKYMTYANNGIYIINDSNELVVINNEVIYTKLFPAHTGIGNEIELTLEGGKKVKCDPQYYFPISEEGYIQTDYPDREDFGREYIALKADDLASGTLEKNFEWYVVTGDLGLDNPFNKYLKRINIRFQLESGTKLKIEVEYDSSGAWEFVTEYYATKRKSYEIPIAVKRADHVRIKLSGWGDVKIFSIAKAVEQGSGETNGQN